MGWRGIEKPAPRLSCAQALRYAQYRFIYGEAMILHTDLARARGIVQHWKRHDIYDTEEVDNVRLITAIAQALQEQRERDAVLVENWAQDNKTVQPSFTKLAKAIRAADTGSRVE